MMFKQVFSFHGRLGRLAFLGWSAAATVLVFAVVVFFLVLGGIFAAVFSADGGGPQILGFGMGVSAVVVGIWSTLALQARRIRDMGFHPWPWMLGVSAMMMADQWLLTHFVDLRFFPPFQQYTPLGGLLAAAYMTVLLLWPSSELPDAMASPGMPAPAQPSRSGEFGLRSRI